MKADTVLADGRNYLVVRDLVVLHVFELFSADRSFVNPNVLRRFGIRDEMRQHRILHLDGVDCVLGGWFINSGNRDHFIASPEDFRSWLLDYLYRFDARHLLRSAGIDAGNARVRIRTAKDFPGKQTVGIVIIGIFGAAGDLHRSVDSRNALAQQWASRGIGPLIIAHDDLPSGWVASATARIPL